MSPRVNAPALIPTLNKLFLVFDSLKDQRPFPPPLQQQCSLFIENFRNAYGNLWIGKRGAIQDYESFCHKSNRTLQLHPQLHAQHLSNLATLENNAKRIRLAMENLGVDFSAVDGDWEDRMKGFLGNSVLSQIAVFPSSDSLPLFLTYKGAELKDDREIPARREQSFQIQGLIQAFEARAEG
jgi:hypothetical protein